MLMNLRICIPNYKATDSAPTPRHTDFYIFCPLCVEKGPGSIAPLWAELWLFKEGNRQFCLKIEANVTDFVNHFQTLISQA